MWTSCSDFYFSILQMFSFPTCPLLSEWHHSWKGGRAAHRSSLSGSPQWPHQMSKCYWRSSTWKVTSQRCELSHLRVFFIWKLKKETSCQWPNLILFLADSLKPWADLLVAIWRSCRVMGVSGYDTSPSTDEANAGIVRNRPWRLKVTRPSGQISAKAPGSYLQRNKAKKTMDMRW